MAAQLAAAASGVMPMLTGPVVAGRVLGRHRTALLIGVPGPGGQRIVSLLTQGASGVPNGVRLSGPADLSRVDVDAPVLVGRRRVDTGALDVRIVRSWDSAVRPGRFTQARVRSLAEAAATQNRGVPSAAVDSLRDALTGPPPHRSPAGAVDGLVGLGQGSTPGGDDVLAGVLTGLHATGSADLVALISARLGRLAGRTTALSADLLGLAADGHACLEALDVVRLAGGAGTDASYAAAVGRLLSIGSTSGADLATGLALGLSVGPGRNQRRLVTEPAAAAVSPAFAEHQGPR